MLNYSSELSEISLPPTDLKALGERLKIIAEPKRLLILNLLMEGVQCNCELGEALDMPPNLISHHLRILREAGLVDVERDALDARWVYYSINREVLDELNEAGGHDIVAVHRFRIIANARGVAHRHKQIANAHCVSGQ